MSEKIVQLNEEIIKGQIKELVRGSVEETLNELLEKEAESLTQAAHRRSRIGTMAWRAGWCGIDPELSENVRAGLKAKVWDEAAPVRLNA